MIMALIDQPSKGSHDDYTNGMTSDEANNWLNEHIQVLPTYILESGVLQDRKGDRESTCAFLPATR